MSTTIIDKMRYQIKWLTQQVECIKEKGCLCFSFETDLTYNPETGELSATFVDDSTRTVTITPAPTEVPTLQEVTTQGNTTDQSMTVGLGVFTGLTPSDIDAAPFNVLVTREWVTQNTTLDQVLTNGNSSSQSMDIGSLSVFSTIQANGIITSDSTIAEIDAAIPTVLPTKEWVLANSGGTPNVGLQDVLDTNSVAVSTNMYLSGFSSLFVGKSSPSSSVQGTEYGRTRIVYTSGDTETNINLTQSATDGTPSGISLGSYDALSNNRTDVHVFPTETASRASIIFKKGFISGEYARVSFGEPLNPEDGATKAYVDANAGGGTTPTLDEVLNEGNTFESTGATNGIEGVNSGSASGIYIETNSTGDSITSNATATATGYHFVGNREGIANFLVDVDGNIEASGSIEADGNVNIGGEFNGSAVSVTGVVQSDSVQTSLVDTNLVDTGNIIGGTAQFSGIVKGITPVAPEDLATKQYVDSAVGGVATAKPKIAFIFDDGFISHRDVVKPIFDARGIKGGLAMSNRLIEAFQRLRADELQDFQKDGWEILGHSVNHETMNTSSIGIGYKRVEAEVKLNIDQFKSYGFHVDGWVTPSSIMDDSFISALHGRFNYGFTKSNGANPIQDYSDRYKLPRFSLEQNTLLQAQEAADAAIDNNQVIVFYTHDVTAGSQKETDLIAIVDYCIAQGYEIVTPREALKERYDFQNYELDDVTIIEKDINAISLVNASETTTSGVMTVTPDTATSTVLAQSTVNLPAYIDVNTQLSFSIDMKLVTGITPTCSIGIQFKNSGGTIIRSDEEGTFEMSTFNLRYYVTNNIPEGTTQITYFVRLITDNDATTTYELSAPLLSTGDNILNITQIPVQAADADTLDGLDSTQFLRSDIDATKTAGHLTLSDATQLRFGDSTDALIQQTVSDFRLRLNNFDEFRITDGSVGSRLRLYRSTGNLWVSGEAEATNLRLNGGTTFSGLLDASGITLNHTWSLPNESGTVALTSGFNDYYDITASNERFMKIASNETITGLKTYTHPSGAIFRHTAPNIRFEDTDGGSNEKNTMIAATGNAWELRFYRDDYSINTAAIRVERVGDQPSHMFFNTPTMEVGGIITATGFNMQSGANIGALSSNLTGPRYWSMPNISGTVALMSSTSPNTGSFDVDGTITSTGFRFDGLSTEPSSSNSPGFAGEIRVTADFIYVCTSTGVWKRTPLSTW